MKRGEKVNQCGTSLVPTGFGGWLQCGECEKVTDERIKLCFHYNACKLTRQQMLKIWGRWGGAVFHARLARQVWWDAEYTAKFSFAGQNLVYEKSLNKNGTLFSNGGKFFNACKLLAWNRLYDCNVLPFVAPLLLPNNILCPNSVVPVVYKIY